MVNWTGFCEAIVGHKLAGGHLVNREAVKSNQLDHSLAASFIVSGLQSLLE